LTCIGSYLFLFDFITWNLVERCAQTYFGEVALELAQLNLKMAGATGGQRQLATALNTVALYLNSQVGCEQTFSEHSVNIQ